MKLWTSLLLGATATVASASVDSTLIFSHEDGPDVVLSYDGAALDIPGYCTAASCTAGASGLAALRAATERVYRVFLANFDKIAHSLIAELSIISRLDSSLILNR